MFTLSIFGQLHLGNDVNSAVYDGVRVWTLNQAGSKIMALDPVTGAKVVELSLAQKGQYLAFDGNRLLLTRNKTKEISVVNHVDGTLQSYINLKTIIGVKKFYLRPLRSGQIMGITYAKGKIWLACGAGYSSSIYEIDPVKHIVLSQRFSPGSSPVALFHNKGNLWVLDKDTSALRCLKNTTKLIRELRVEAGKNPKALLAINGKLLVVNEERGPKTLKIAEIEKLVPEKVDMRTFSPYFKKERKAVRTKGRKVAFLISGDSAESGYNEFWVDVVVMYRILKDRGYNEIYTLYAAGKDYNCPWDKYKEPMTDFAATKENVAKIFDAFANGNTELGIRPLTASDTLFIFTFDHGARDGNLCLWRGGRYSPREMAGALKNINCGKMLIYMQQCFGGAFKTEFKNANMNKVVIVTASSDSEYAYRADTEKEYYGGKPYYHGEFNWHFMSALARKTLDGNSAVNADNNSDGKISVKETFEYYKKQNSNGRQTPQYYSNPVSLDNETP